MALAQPVQSGDWQPTDEDLAGLSPRARDWLRTALQEYQFDAVAGRRLLEAMRTLSRIEALEDALRADGAVTKEGAPSRLLAALDRAQRVFLSQWAALRLERE